MYIFDWAPHEDILMKSNEIEYATNESLISNDLDRVYPAPKFPRKELIDEPVAQVTVLTAGEVVQVV